MTLKLVSSIESLDETILDPVEKAHRDGLENVPEALDKRLETLTL